MSLLQHVTEILARTSSPYTAGRYVVVPTLLSYSNGGGVQAYIEGGENYFVVSDGGGAARSYISAGGAGPTCASAIRSAVRGYGAAVNESGHIYVSQHGSEHLPFMIAQVAEASLAADEALTRLLKRSRKRASFKDYVGVELQQAAGLRQVVKRPHVLGASNKNHEFDFAVPLPGDRRLVVDAVVQDANSINSAVVAHLDVKHAHQGQITQLIVYDDEAKWSGSNLALLGVGAPPVPASQLAHHISGMMH